MPDYYPLPVPPEDQFLSQLESIIRTGLPPALPGANWTGERCPAGHWLMPQGSRIFRGDVPDQIETPCVTLFFLKDAESVLTTHQDYWRLAPTVTVMWNRDLTTQETDQIRFCLLAVLTQDLTAPVPTGQRSIKDRLSLAPTDETPGIRVFDIRNIQYALDRSNSGHPEFFLSFEALCMSLQLTA